MNAREAFAAFEEPARAALIAAVELNSADLDALAEQYAREQMASAQSETDYQANEREYNRG
jgi:hypothetical protein